MAAHRRTSRQHEENMLEQAESQQGHRDIRLNSFAFPSETGIRSLLLAAALLALFWQAGMTFSAVLFRRADVTPLDQMVGSPSFDVLDIQRDLSGIEGFEELNRRLDEKLDRLKASAAERRQLDQEFDRRLARHSHEASSISIYLSTPLVFSILPALLLAFAYVSHRFRFEYGRKVAALTEGSHPDDHAAVQGIVGEIQDIQRSQGEEVTESPIVKIGREARAYGFPGRYVLQLPRSIKADLSRAERKVQARFFVGHEFAHLANRDVSLSIWVSSLGPILLALFVLQVAAIFIFQSAPPLQSAASVKLGLLLRLIAIVLVIEMIRRSILREIECHADARTLAWWPEARRVLKEWVKGSARKSSRPSRHLWAVWRKHPSTEKRLQAIDEPSILLRARNSVAFVAGILFSYMSFTIAMISSTLVAATPALGSLFLILATRWLADTAGIEFAMRFYYRFDWVLFLPLILLGGGGLLLAGSYLVSGTIGLQVQRESVVQIVRGDHGARVYASLWRPALCVTLGLYAGFVLVPFAPVPSIRPEGMAVVWLWLPLTTVSMWLWLAATRYLARRLLRPHAGGSPPVAKRRVLATGRTVLLTLALLAPLMGLLVLTPYGDRLGRPLPAIAGILGWIGFGMVFISMLFGIHVFGSLRIHLKPVAFAASVATVALLAASALNRFISSYLFGDPLADTASMLGFMVFFILISADTIPIDLAGGVAYGWWHSRRGALRVADCALGGALVGFMSRLISNCTVALVEMVANGLYDPVIAGVSAIEHVVLSFFGSLAVTVPLLFLGIVFGGLGGVATAWFLHLRKEKLPVQRMTS